LIFCPEYVIHYPPCAFSARVKGSCADADISNIGALFYSDIGKHSFLQDSIGWNASRKRGISIPLLFID